MHAPAQHSSWRLLFRLAAPYRGRFVLIVVLAALAAGAELCEPLLYRIAVNDVSGVFVKRAAAQALATPHPHGGPSRQSASGAPHLQRRLHSPREAHRRHYVAPRTVMQMFVTLLWVVALLFVTSVSARFLALTADNMSTAVANRIEADLIRATFGHVLKLPLSFFSQRASGALV